MALTVLASRSRFEFINVSKLIETLKENAAQIEKKFSVISEEGTDLLSNNLYDNLHKLLEEISCNFK